MVLETEDTEKPILIFSFQLKWKMLTISICVSLLCAFLLVFPNLFITSHKVSSGFDIHEFYHKVDSLTLYRKKNMLKYKKLWVQSPVPKTKSKPKQEKSAQENGVKVFSSSLPRKMTLVTALLYFIVNVVKYYSRSSVRGSFCSQFLM